MSKTQTTPSEMSTEELLRVATARPWIVDSNADYIAPSEWTPTSCAIAQMVLSDHKEANAELIRRMAGSFEALRAVAMELVTRFDTASMVYAIREGNLAIADREPYSETATLPETPLVKMARTALALSEGKQP